MFEGLRPFPTIVVTGPQRSGSKIVAEIVAEELGLPYVRESEYGVHSLGRFIGCLSERGVIHAPAMSAYCHLLPIAVAVVFVIRNLAEIATSEAHVPGWTETEGPRELAKYFCQHSSAAEVKYDVWERFQKPAMLAERKSFFEVRYPEEVMGHRRFVPPEGRVGWAPDQTRAYA